MRWSRPMGGVLLGLCVAASCARDERELQLVVSGLNPGGSGGLPGAAGPGSAARLDVGAPEVDLGWVSLGFPARARIRLSNAGGAPLEAPVVSWATAASDFEIIQNQCTRLLTPGSSCELRVQFIPSQTGERSATLHAESPGGGTGDISFKGLGLEPGGLILAPIAGSFEDFGGVRLGSTLQGSFSLTNPGSAPSGPVTFQTNRPEFEVLPPSAAGDCASGSTALAVGESCNLRIAFAPSERGPLETTLTGRSDGSGSVSLTLAGRGLLPATLQSTAPLLDFSGVVLGSAAQRAVSFQNLGDEPLNIAANGILPATGSAFSIQSSDCGGGRSLAAGKGCSVQLEFRPTQAGAALPAQLSVDAAPGQQRQIVELSGAGLEPGPLLVDVVSAGDQDFGRVLVDGALDHTFQISNPTTQPSGVLSLRGSDAFEVVSPPGEGECVEGFTSLSAGESCRVRVRFQPTRRELAHGALTVSSALTGAKALALTGQGIVPAALEVEPEINFGRVFTNAAATRTLIVRNAGDEPLLAPSLELSSSTDARAMAFAYESTCLQPLGFGEQCSLSLRFTPTQAVPYAASLKLTAGAAGSSSVLLLGEALAAGSLVLAAAEGSSADFGDVQLGSSASRSFTLTNPGGNPSGRLLLRTDNSRFQAQEGDCNQDPAGLANGASCTFNVLFAPDLAVEVVTTLLVQSSGAGQVGLELRGNGRTPATLAATGNRDLGRANIGQDALTQPENQFTWTVNNEGDVATGPLTLSLDNPTEFERSNDTCSNAAVPGRGSCQISLRFRPSDVGVRNATLTLTDPTSGRSVSLALTGTGRRLANLGQSCLDAECSAGTCTRGVCCDRPCDGTCQVCSAAGVCSDQENRELCGNGNGRCFGVNRCLLPEGQACGQAADCGQGNCELRLDGTGPGDRLCCTADCDATATQCNAQGQCEQPTLDEGALCGGANDLPCAAGLQCKACLGGGNRCTPANRCCGGCGTGYECINGTSCGCPTLANGQRGIDCGNGLCVQNRAGACCPATPECAAARPNCDPADNLCKECFTAAQCAGGNRACNGGTCACAPGARDCGGGRCVGGNQCCQTCNGGQVCNPTSGACECPANQTLVNGQCRLNLGQPCMANGTACNGECINGRCCEAGCSGLCRQCQANGRCAMPADDNNCPQITCPGPNGPCQTAGAGNANINASSCQSLGVCKTAASCAPPVNLGIRTACGPSVTIENGGCGNGPCSVTPICNATGACRAPVVSCGGQTLTDVEVENCCSIPFPGDTGAAAATDFFCSAGASDSITAWCDGANDCPTGTFCCLAYFGNFNTIACQANCPADTLSGVVCRSPGETTNCPGGTTCTPLDGRSFVTLNGWSVCQ